MPGSQWFLGVVLAASIAVNAALFQQLLASQEQVQKSLSRQAQLETSERQMQLQLQESERQRSLEVQKAAPLLAAHSQPSEGMMDFSRIPIRTIQRMGHLFFAQKLSETIMDNQVMNVMGYDRDFLGRQQYLTHHGYEMLSVRVSPNERAEGQLQGDTVQSMVDRLDEAGMVLIPSLHDPERCRRLAHKVHADIMDPKSEYGSIVQLELRKDMPLLLSGDYLEILRDSLLLLKPVFERTLGKGAVLKEFSTLTSYPGATEQGFHHDSLPDEDDPRVLVKEAKLFSAFIYLDDVGEFSAPFDAVPGTHSHIFFNDDATIETMRFNPWVRLAVPQGSLVIYDSRLRHRGSANTSPLTRPTFYFSLQEANKPAQEGPTYSLHKTYKKHTISVDDIIARNIPPDNVEEMMADHDDELCEKSMNAACPGAPSARAFYECAINPKHRHRNPRLPGGSASSSSDSDDTEEDYERDWRSRRYRRLPLANCTLRSRMEKIAQANIFEPEFEVKVSWGNL